MRETSPAPALLSFLGSMSPPGEGIGWRESKRALYLAIPLLVLDACRMLVLRLTWMSCRRSPSTQFLSRKDCSDVNGSLTASFSFFSRQSTLRSSWDFFICGKTSPKGTAKWPKSSCLLWFTWSGHSTGLPCHTVGVQEAVCPHSSPLSPGQPC